LVIDILRVHPTAVPLCRFSTHPLRLVPPGLKARKYDHAAPTIFTVRPSNIYEPHAIF
jgi:hypothetical protein